MSFEDLEPNFEKKANKKVQTNFEAMNEENFEASAEDKEKYEDIAEEKPIHGLLALFQEKLLNRKHSSTESSDEEFETINITSGAVTPTSSVTENEVSEEAIEDLLNTSPEKYGEKFENIDTSVERTLTSFQRYETSHPVTENTARPEDTQSNQVFAPTGNTSGVSPTPYTQRHISDDEVGRHIAEHRRKKAEDAEISQERLTDSSQDPVE